MSNEYYQQYLNQQAMQAQAGQPCSNDPGGLASWTQGWFDFNDSCYVKGLLVGAVAACVLTNPKVQRALVKGAVSLWTSVQGGVEELKEQVQDIKSEMSLKQP